MKFSSIELLKKMLDIYSPSGHEEDLAHFLQETMKNLGFVNTRMDIAGNVYGEVGSGFPTILLCGHMDTVTGKIPVEIKHNKIYGRGAVDAKSSLASMIVAASETVSSKNKGKIIVAGIVDEERTARGINQLLKENLDLNYAIFGEPSGLNNITFAYKGRLELRIICKGKAGHIGAQHLLPSLIARSFTFWRNLKKTFKNHSSPNGIFYSLTGSLTRIRSYGYLNATPHTCSLTIDIRLPPTITCESATKIVTKEINTFQKANPDISVKTFFTGKIESFIAKRNTVLIEALKSAIEETTKKPVRFLRKTGTGDMNIFGTKTTIPVATYGPGNGMLSHTSKENLDLREYLASTKIYRKTLENLSLTTRKKG